MNYSYRIIESIERFPSSLYVKIVKVEAEVIMESDPAQTIQAVIGEEFTLSLTEKPSTGYNWKAIFDNKYLELVSEEYDTNKLRPGSASIHKFIFKGLEKGEFHLKMVSQRGWEDMPVNQKLFLIKIS